MCVSFINVNFLQLFILRFFVVLNIIIYNLFVGIEDLCAKRDELHQQILQEEEEKRKVQNDIRILTERLVQINESLARKIATRNDYDRTVAECETAYKKVCVEHCYNS